jgi:hypothetical protein
MKKYWESKKAKTKRVDLDKRKVNFSELGLNLTTIKQTFKTQFIFLNICNSWFELVDR